jgi:anti-sigma regulatory factor (Ser/Thr protein kinase)
MDEDRRISLEVPCDTGAPKVVRDALRAAHDGGWSLADGLLIASELITNAVTHSGCHGADQLHVEIERDPECLRISVEDPGLSEQDAELQHGERSGPGGWGLQIIEQLSAQWGTERPDGYRVWAELAAERPNPASDGPRR